jgi:large repetitive protein
MKLKKYTLLLLSIILWFNQISAQLITPFTPRLSGESLKIKGDLVLIGNNIVNSTVVLPTGFDATGEPLNLAVLTTEANIPNDGSLSNNGQNMEYIDIDGNPNTFSSSRADLAIGTNPDGTVNLAVQQCKKIVYAGLYWTASYPFERYTGPSVLNGTNIKQDWNQIKFKMPGGDYIDIVADDQSDLVNEEDAIILSPTLTPNIFNKPYVCYKNVTTLLQTLSEPNGQYFVANQRASRGQNPNGNCGGWSLVVIYESPILQSKYISTFDGFANINAGSSTNVDFNINGFLTIPTGSVRAKIGVGALEGDRNLMGDNLQFKGNSKTNFTTIFNTLNPTNNFFNGTISNTNFYVTNRLPNSSNTLGFDLDLLTVNNPLNDVLSNNETGATIRLRTSGDAYGAYLTTFAVDIIEPNIQLKNNVRDLIGVSVEGQDVGLCKDLLYVIGFQNIGNDDAGNFKIKDVLPLNVTFNPATDLTLPLGVTLDSYSPLTREIVLSVDNDLVKRGDPRYEILIKIKTACSCLDLENACTQISNQVFGNYNGTVNTNIFSTAGSNSVTCDNTTPTPASFFIKCDSVEKSVLLCNSTVTLTSVNNNYQNYIWTGPQGASIVPVSGTNNQSVIVDLPGTYSVKGQSGISSCNDITQTFNVFDTNSEGINPILAYNENLPAQACPNNGKVLPHIFLCGVNDSQLLKIDYIDTQSVIWEKLNPSISCVPLTDSLCANEALSSSCWSQVNSGVNYTVNSPGEYRLTINYEGNCSKTFYFNVYQNFLDPTYVKKDVVCNSLGEITIGNVPVNNPSSYIYTLVPGNTTSPNPNTTGVFVGIAAGLYDVVITETGAVNGCKFTIPSIPIIKKRVNVETTIIDALCFDDKGSITLTINEANPQYNFSLFNTSGALINSSGLVNQNSYTFPSVPSGSYTYSVTSSSPDNCNLTGAVQIKSGPQLFINAGITKPILPCSDGEITFNGSGGVAPYSYNINGVLYTGNTIPVSGAGSYFIEIIDSNNCKANTIITVAPTLEPKYSPILTNVSCFGNNTGVINFNVSSPTGTMVYSIDGGATFNTSPIFNNLSAGVYSLLIQYTVMGVTCITATKSITISEPTEAINPNVLVINGVFTAEQNGASYQWFDCKTNLQIPNETNQVFIPLNSGSYKVQITNNFGCTVSSICYDSVTLNVNEYSKIGVRILPNPVKDSFRIEGNVIIKNLTVYNNLGQKVQIFYGNNKEYSIKDLQSGFYIVQLESDKGVYSSMIIKQ